MDDVGSVMILVIRSVPLSCCLRNLEKIECLVAEAMAATLGVDGYRECVESWLTAGKHWVAICPARCRAVCRVCSRVVEAKAKVRVDPRVKLLGNGISLVHGRGNEVQLLGDGPGFISSSSRPSVAMARA